MTPSPPTSAIGSRPRGRPQRLPVDITPWEHSTIDGNRRMAWLLAVTRLLSPTTAPGGRRGFIEAMGARGIRLDTSRVSRLEAGEQTPLQRVIAGYEQVSGVPAGSLQSVNALLRRASGLAGSVEKGLGVSSALLDESFERIDRQRADGSDWLRVSRELETRERVYLPPQLWASLTTQLVGELTRATGMAHVRRYEAAASLLHNSTGRRHLTMAIGRFVMDPDAQSVTPALALLQEVNDHPAGELVLRLMGEGNPLLRRGAAGVAGALAARDGFVHDRYDALERHVGSELSRDSPTLRRSDALDLASRLPEASYARILGAVNDTRVRSALTRACTSLELVDRDVSRTTCEGIATFAEAAAGRAAQDPDQMLRRLLREALFHVHRDRRQLAAIVLAASPYARPVAEAAMSASVERNDATAAMSWSLLRRMGHVLDRGEVAERAFAEKRPALHASALITLGLSTGAVPHAMGEHLLRTAHEHSSTRLGHAATFALGMSGHQHLQALANQAGPCQRAALWWTSVGSALHDNAQVNPDR